MSNEFEIFWKPFTRVFQALCVSHYSVFRPKIKKNFLKSLPYLLYYLFIYFVNFAILFSSTNKGFSNSTLGRYQSVNKEVVKFKNSPLMSYVNALSLFGSIAVHVSICLESFLCGKKENQICEKLNQISNIFASNLNYNISYNVRRIRYIRNSGVFVFVIFTAIVCSFSTLPDAYHDKFFMTPIMLFSVVITRARWYQIALFLHIIADALEDLQFLLTKQQQLSFEQTNVNEPRSNYDPEKIRYIYEIYSNIWSIVALISDCFG